MKLAIAALFWAVVVAAAPAPPTLQTVLARASAYVADFQSRLAGIVAEERYVQEWKKLPRRAAANGDPRRRALVSDLLLVKLPSGARWMQFRDVFEVDAAPVRDRGERLLKLFLDPGALAEGQVDRILSESSRYNIGNIQRTVNTPTLALAFLEPGNLARFKFSQGSDRIPALAEDAIAAERSDLFVIRFQESGPDTVIHTNNGQSALPSHGRFWVEPDTGHVLLTELVAEDRNVRATIDVSYGNASRIGGILMPAAMRERYEGRNNGSVIEGTATYGRFRQFQVNVNEKFLVK